MQWKLLWKLLLKLLVKLLVKLLNRLGRSGDPEARCQWAVTG